MADINGDNCIDYEEFMKHFSDMLRRIRFMDVVLDALKKANEPQEEGIPDEMVEDSKQDD